MTSRIESIGGKPSFLSDQDLEANIAMSRYPEPEDLPTHAARFRTLRHIWSAQTQKLPLSAYYAFQQLDELLRRSAECLTKYSASIGENASNFYLLFSGGEDTDHAIAQLSVSSLPQELTRKMASLARQVRTQLKNLCRMVPPKDIEKLIMPRSQTLQRCILCAETKYLAGQIAKFQQERARLIDEKLEIKKNLNRSIAQWQTAQDSKNVLRMKIFQLHRALDDQKNKIFNIFNLISYHNTILKTKLEIFQTIFPKDSDFLKMELQRITAGPNLLPILREDGADARSVGDDSQEGIDGSAGGKEAAVDSE